MLLRRTAPAALLTAAICACEPGVGYDASRNPTQTNYAVFDPSATPPQIPLPNDLALQQAANVPGAQGELLKLFVSQGGFPNDQEVPITLDLVNIVVDPTGAEVRSKPALDFTTIRICKGTNPDCTLAVMKLTPTGGFESGIDQPQASDYVLNGDHGTLTIHRSLHSVPSGSGSIQSRAWDAGVHYVAAIRGGANGVKTTDGQIVYPQPAMFLLLQGKDLTKRENQGLIPGDSQAAKDATAQQLEALRQNYLKGPFPALSLAFPPPPPATMTTDIATMTTFQIAPAGPSSAQPVIDASAGVVPLPSNLLLNGKTLPDDPLAPATNAKVANIATFGPLAPGLATLDGFSTTALLLVPTSAPVIVATDPGPTSAFTNNVFLYDLSDPNNPVLVDPTTYDDLLPAPARLHSGGIWASALVGVQPAAATKLTTSKPLKEATEYAFIVTKRIVSATPTPTPLGRPTVASIVLFDNPVWAGGKSLLAGVPDDQAKILERMRVQIGKVLPKLQALSGPATTSKADIALAYTFRTQTITATALQLAAAPYAAGTNPNVNFVGPINILTPAQAFTKYGVEAVVVGTAANIQEVIEANLPTPDLLSPTTGTFDPNLVPPITVIPALIVVPKVALVTAACPGGSGLKCAPLVVFHHGLNGGRAQMLLTANELAGKGFVVAAIDAPKHGDRSFCSADSQCAPGGTCKAIGPPGTQGDTIPPGLCRDANGNPTPLAKKPVLCFPNPAPPAPPTACNSAPDGIAVASGNYVISGNLFRTRDTFRQDIIDNSNLILALARPPPPRLPPTAAMNPVTVELATFASPAPGIAVDPLSVFWEGQSLGGILGTINVASNPRISEAVLNVPGGTFVDIASTSPAFAPTLIAILHAQGIEVGTPQFLQFLQVAKWVLDPAEPINFAGRMIGDASHPTLPDLLTPAAAQQGKKIYGQMAVCDNVVPNAFNLLLFNVAGLAPGAVNGTTFFKNTTATAPGFCMLPAPFDSGTVAHGFLLDHGLTNGGATNDVDISTDARNFAANYLFLPAAQLPADSK